MPDENDKPIENQGNLTLHPDVQRVFASHFDCDVVDWSAPLVILKSGAATDLSNSKGNLGMIRADIERLRSRDQVALSALDRVCGWDWQEDVGTSDSLQEILAEMLKALDFRIRWNAKRA